MPLGVRAERKRNSSHAACLGMTTGEFFRDLLSLWGFESDYLRFDLQKKIKPHRLRSVLPKSA
jgi:hypothetical protein